MMVERRRRGGPLTALMLVAGMLLLIAAVAGLVITPEHVPTFSCVRFIGNVCSGPSSTTGWSQTTHDVARIAMWAA
jgi:hypothetical protein